MTIDQDLHLRADEPAEPQPPRKKHATRNILLGFLAAFLVVAVAAGIFVVNLGHSFDTKTVKIASAFPNESVRPAPITAGPTANAMNILLLGSDSRGDSVEMAEGGNASNQRSDSMIWVHIPADRKNIYMMSIMRDTWVDIPGHGEAKINAAMAFGGVPLAVQTLEGMFKTRLDHVAVVDFDGFKAMTDAVGGVQIDVPTSFKSLAGPSFTAGPQTLNGDLALAFVRERYAFADGDYQRVKDQQIFMKAVMSKFLTADTLTNPLRVSEVINTVSPFVSVDKGLDSGTAGALAVSLRDVRAANVIPFTLPTNGTGTSPDGQQSIVLRNDTAIDGIAAALQHGGMDLYLTNAGLKGK